MTCVVAIVHVDASTNSVSALTINHPLFANLVRGFIAIWQCGFVGADTRTADVNVLISAIQRVAALVSLRVGNRRDMGLVTCVTAIIHVDPSTNSVSALTMNHPLFANQIDGNVGYGNMGSLVRTREQRMYNTIFGDPMGRCSRVPTKWRSVRIKHRCHSPIHSQQTADR